MLSFDEAKQIALERIGPECVLLESATLEKPYGWYFVLRAGPSLRPPTLNRWHSGAVDS